MIVLSFFMHKKSNVRKSITTHAFYVLVAFAAILSVRQIVNIAIKEYNIEAVTSDVVDTACYAAMAIVAINQVFQLITRLTHNSIHKGNDATNARMVSRILKVIIILFAFLIFGERLGIGFSGLLAFGGIGGIAIGVAGKDILGNIFSGVMLYFDRPFSIGDWISSPDRQIEGTVSEIGWRLTKIMTFDNRPIYVPNAVFSLIIVENSTRMTNRRISTSIELRYEDAAKVAKIVEDIRALLYASNDIDTTQDLLVYFSAFNPSSLSIMVYCFTKTTSWSNWLSIQQGVYLSIVDIVRANGAELALPSQDISFKNQPNVMPLVSSSERPPA